MNDLLPLDNQETAERNVLENEYQDVCLPKNIERICDFIPTFGKAKASELGKGSFP